MSVQPDHSSTKAAETVINLQRFMKDSSREFGLNWAAFVILATLASPDVPYLSSSELIQRTGLNRCWGYKTIRMLLQKGLIAFVEQRGHGNRVRKLYAGTGKGKFFLAQTLKPNGIRLVKAFEGHG